VVARTMDNGQGTRGQGDKGTMVRTMEQWTMDNGTWTMEQGTMDNRIRNNGTRNKNIDIVSAHRTMRDKEGDHETMRKRTKSWYVTDQLSRGSFPTVRATAVGRDAEWNAVLAGDPKCLVYYVISKLNRTYLAGDPKRKG